MSTPVPRLQYAACLLVCALGAGLVHGPRIARNCHKAHWEDWRFFRAAHTELQSVGLCFVRPSVLPGLYRPLSTNLY